MNTFFSRVLWGIAGVLLIICGIVCLAQPAVALTTVTLFLGISMMVSGIVDIVIFAKGNNAMLGAGWFLVDGILTVLLSLLILFNQAFTALSLPFILRYVADVLRHYKVCQFLRPAAHGRPGAGAGLRQLGSFWHWRGSCRS